MKEETAERRAPANFSACRQCPGSYNQQVLSGFDYLIAEMGKRGIRARVILNNEWQWCEKKAPPPGADEENHFFYVLKNLRPVHAGFRFFLHFWSVLPPPRVKERRTGAIRAVGEEWLQGR